MPLICSPVQSPAHRRFRWPPVPRRLPLPPYTAHRQSLKHRSSGRGTPCPYRPRCHNDGHNHTVCSGKRMRIRCALPDSGWCCQPHFCRRSRKVPPLRNFLLPGVPCVQNRSDNALTPSSSSKDPGPWPQIHGYIRQYRYLPSSWSLPPAGCLKTPLSSPLPGKYTHRNDRDTRDRKGHSP